MSTQVETLSVQEIASKLVELCREDKHNEAISELYDDQAVSVEPDGAPMPRTEGKEAILKATEHWFSTVEEVHSTNISDPIVAGNFFACTMNFDVTYKEQGRNTMDELAVYEVEDGKIVSAQFFYNA